MDKQTLEKKVALFRQAHTLSDTDLIQKQYIQAVSEGEMLKKKLERVERSCKYASAYLQVICNFWFFLEVFECAWWSILGSSDASTRHYLIYIFDLEYV